MSSKKLEIRSLRNSLTTYLASASWTGLQFSEKFGEDTVTVPLIAIHYLPSAGKNLQLGGKGNEKLYQRVIQIDAYMETEDRADAIVDDVMDFFDLVSVVIVDQSNQPVGSLICQNSDTIYGDTLAPILDNPKVTRWRGIIRATVEAHYFAP